MQQELVTFIIVGETGSAHQYRKTSPARFVDSTDSRKKKKKFTCFQYSVGEIVALFQKKDNFVKHSTFYLNNKGEYIEDSTLRSELPGGKLIIYNERPVPPPVPALEIDDLRIENASMSECTDYLKLHSNYFEGCEANLEEIVVNFKLAMKFYEDTKDTQYETFTNQLSEFQNRQAAVLKTFDEDFEKVNKKKTKKTTKIY